MPSGDGDNSGDSKQESQQQQESRHPEASDGGRRRLRDEVRIRAEAVGESVGAMLGGLRDDFDGWRAETAGAVEDITNGKGGGGGGGE